MKTIALLALSVLMLAGCGVLRPRLGTDTTDAARLIHQTAREGTALAIKKIYEDDQPERILAAAKLKSTMDEYVLPLLNNPDREVTIVLEEKLLSTVPEQYHGIMATAYETLHTYYEFPATSEVLPEPYLTYLKAFFNGIREGADAVLFSEGVEESTTLIIPIGE